MGNAREFSSSRQFAAWLGLVPGQYSSGGKTRLGRITKAGDAYLRGLLVMGARAVLNAARNKTDSISRWATNIALRHERRRPDSEADWTTSARCSNCVRSQAVF